MALHRKLINYSTVFLLLFFQIHNAQTFQYVNPKPGSFLNSNETNIILRCSEEIDEFSLKNSGILVLGSISGNHTGELLLSDDNRTIVFNPDTKFAGNENVSVTLLKGVMSLSGTTLAEYSFAFETEPDGLVKKYGYQTDENYIAAKKQYAYSNINSLPAPTITINSLNDPYPGNIFMATWDRNVPAQYSNYIFVLDKDGNIVDSVKVDGAPFDFKIQPNGYLSYGMGDFSINVPKPGEDFRYIILDDDLNEVDRFSMKNGYTTDFHEFHYLPNGHVWMMSYFTIVTDMSQIVEGGKTNASLVINIIQEQDKDKNVVFEWRNLDYIPITDTDLPLTSTRINYSTLNAFEIDTDGNILASFRNHSEIMKISRTTGEVLWRCGSPRGEFTFIGEHEENAPYYFSRLHNVHRMDNGNISIFDNGEAHDPSYSRGVEYELDEVNKTITMVSEYRYPNGNIFAAAAGNATKYDDGGWFLGFGILHPLSEVKRNIVEVNGQGAITFELSLPNNVIAYRASKQLWKNDVDMPAVFIQEMAAGNTYVFNDENNITGVSVEFTTLTSAAYNDALITRLPYGPVNPEFVGTPIIYPVSVKYEVTAIYTQTAHFHFDLTQYPEIDNPGNASVYWRNFIGQGLFVELATTYDPVLNELVATTNGFGEFVFGEPDLEGGLNAPIVYEPSNSQKLKLQDTHTLRWTGKGSYDSFNIEVATDESFTNIILNEVLNLSFIEIDNLTNNTQYFWRVKAILGGNESAWSQTFNFEITDEFITVLSPNGSEELSITASVVIRWETNITDTLTIALLKDEQNLLDIGAAPGSHGALQWDIPNTLEVGGDYKIQIMSLVDQAFVDVSDNNFSIVDTTTGVGDEISIPDEYVLNQNYPNPFNPATIISYSLPAAGNTTLKVYDLLGNEIVTLVDGGKHAGYHEVVFNAVNLPSGIYFYSLISGQHLSSKKMMFLK